MVAVYRSFPMTRIRLGKRMLNPAQLFFAATATGYLLLMTGYALFRSESRRSVLLAGDGGTQSGAQLGIDSTEQNPSRLQLQDFHRVEVKNGKAAWEVHAKDARYYPQAAVTHVNDAILTLFREGQSSITVKSNAAKLASTGEAIGGVGLEGEVEFKIGNELTLYSETADYTADKRRVSIPGKVRIAGVGFEVKGVGLVYNLDGEQLSLSEDVECSFEPQAKLPRDSMVQAAGKGSAGRSGGTKQKDPPVQK